ncbi:MAG: RNase P modulator RnpM [Chloroflexota bacterium]
MAQAGARRGGVLVARQTAPRQPLATRRTPTRTCVACRTARAKRELVRIVRTPGGEIRLDPTGKQNGRGAYLCADGQCWTNALRSKAIERALRAQLDDALRERLATGPESPSNATTPDQTPITTTHQMTNEMTGGGAGGKE